MGTVTGRTISNKHALQGHQQKNQIGSQTCTTLKKMNIQLSLTHCTLSETQYFVNCTRKITLFSQVNRNVKFVFLQYLHTHTQKYQQVVLFFIRLTSTCSYTIQHMYVYVYTPFILHILVACKSVITHTFKSSRAPQVHLVVRGALLLGVDLFDYIFACGLIIHTILLSLYTIYSALGHVVAGLCTYFQIRV